VSDPKSKTETEKPEDPETQTDARNADDDTPQTADLEADAADKADQITPEQDSLPDADKDPDAIEDAELVETVQDHDADDHDAPEREDRTEHAEPEPEQTTAAPQTTVIEKRGGFFGPFLGGVVAAGIGFGVCYYLINQGMLPMGDEDAFAEDRAQISALSDQISALQTEISGMGEDPRVEPLSDGVSALQSEIADVRAEVSALQAEIEAQTSLMEGMQSELDAIAEMPVGTGGADTAAVAALQTRLQEQQAANAEMQTQLQEMAAQARSEMDAVRDRAGALQAETQAAVDDATNRAALANVTAALESGTPLASALANITVEVPDALSDVADSGVMTVLELQRSFPAAARDGLSESLKVTVGDAPTDRLFAFVRAQVGARSLEGYEGDDPDAILARAQDAVSSASFAEALTELAALPEEGRAAMAGWISDAQARVDAVAARDALAAELISN
jgi:hypothetical protein